MTDKTLRQYEEILDRHYETYSIVSEPINDSLFPLFFAFDSMFICMIDINSEKIGVGTYQTFKALDEGFQKAVKWITQKQIPTKLNPSRSSELIDNAGDFLLFAKNYEWVSVMHKMYSEKMLAVDIDSDDYRVRFFPPTSSHRKPWYSFSQEVEYVKRHTNISQFYEDALRELAEVRISFVDGRIIIEDIKEICSNGIKRFTKASNLKEIVPIDIKKDFGGFTYEEYKNFVFGLKCWSQCLLLLYFAHSQNGKSQLECMPTQLLNYDTFCTNMERLSGVSNNSVRLIVKRLTYDFKSEKRDIFLQPFIIVDNKILWSPLSIYKSNLERNILKLMTRDSKLKALADNLIGDREKEFLRMLGLHLATRGYQYQLNTKLNYNDLTCELDMLAYKGKYVEEVLLIEAKTILAVDDFYEIKTASTKLDEAITQLERCSTILQSMPNNRKKDKFRFAEWNNVKHFFKIIITPDSHPFHSLDNRGIPITTYTTLKTHAKSKDYEKPSRIWEFCQRYQYSETNNSETEYKYIDIKIGKILYQIPCATPKT